MIEISNLTKSFGKHKVLDNITFRVGEGEVLGFLGANGAGKSTTMNIITGYLSSNEGKVLINGINILEEPEKAKKLIGYLPEQPPLYLNMTVSEYLDFVYQLKGIKLNEKAEKGEKSEKQQHIEEICEMCGITGVYKRLIGNLSKGYRQRVGLAQALIGNPEVLILDEPTVGLDPVQIIEIRNLIRELGKKHTVILSSHILSEVSAICEKVIIIHNGRIAAASVTDKLIKEFQDSNRLRLTAEGDAQELVKTVSVIYGVDSVEIDETKTNSSAAEIIIRTSKDVRGPIMSRLVEKNIGVINFGLDTVSLEDIFLKYVGGESDEGSIQERAE
ncbi:MAG: ATP-binding cassette domain-containing protein [Bacillota bacterium]|nr:ATP-binding cassette domain-containing protein [Bacillota bacterium]